MIASSDTVLSATIASQLAAGWAEQQIAQFKSGKRIKSAAIEIQAAARVLLQTFFKVSTELSNDFRGTKFTVHEVCFSKVRYEGYNCKMRRCLSDRN